MAASFLLALLAASSLRAQEEPSPEIAGLQQAAADFVIASNAKDAAAIAALFTENGEMADLRAADTITGRAGHPGKLRGTLRRRRHPVGRGRSRLRPLRRQGPRD